MKKTNIILTALLSLCVTGCTQIEKAARVKPAGISPFLEHSELLVAQKATFPFHYFYLKPNAGTYKNIYVAPVTTKYLRKNENWAKLDQKMAEKIGSDIQKLATYTQNTFKAEFVNAAGPRKLAVVDSPNRPGTLIVELAIVSIIPTKAELNIIGTAGNIFLPGIGVITGHFAGGAVTMECMVRDAKTKEIIAMFANTEKDQRAILNFAGMTWYTSAEKNIKKQAKSTANIFSGADYSSTRRRLIKIVEF